MYLNSQQYTAFWHQGTKASFCGVFRTVGISWTMSAVFWTIEDDESAERNLIGCSSLVNESLHGNKSKSDERKQRCQDCTDRSLFLFDIILPEHSNAQILS